MFKKSKCNIEFFGLQLLILPVLGVCYQQPQCCRGFRSCHHCNILFFGFYSAVITSKDHHLRDAKARGWRAANTMFRLGAVPARPEIFNIVDAQDRQLHRHTIRRENLLRSTMPASQCDKCGSVCTHCMHCDSCQKRIDDACAAPSSTATIASGAVVLEDASAEPSSYSALSSKNSGVRCLHCKREYFDKSGYNRHLGLFLCPRKFEFIIRVRKAKRKQWYQW